LAPHAADQLVPCELRGLPALGCLVGQRRNSSGVRSLLVEGSLDMRLDQSAQRFVGWWRDRRDLQAGLVDALRECGGSDLLQLRPANLAGKLDRSAIPLELDAAIVALLKESEMRVSNAAKRRVYYVDVLRSRRASDRTDQRH